jgi:hypothetical protein
MRVREREREGGVEAQCLLETIAYGLVGYYRLWQALEGFVTAPEHEIALTEAVVPSAERQHRQGDPRGFRGPE